MGADARQLTRNNAQELADWCGGKVVTQHNAVDHDLTTPGVNVPTPEGVQRAQVGDTIIRYVDNTFHIFQPRRTNFPYPHD